MSDALRIILHGASGRMGRAIEEVAADDASIEIAAAFDPRSSGQLPQGDVVIDFSLPEAMPGLMAALDGTGKPLVSGTTGLPAEAHAALRKYANSAPVFYAENMSYGIAVLTELLAGASRTLRGSSEVEIVETHHKHKKDAPSGTALALARAIDGGEGRDVPIHSVRAGGVPGDHQVIFAADEEVVTISHRALSRRVFARGAVRAARFVSGRDAGFYRMHDLVEAEQEALITKG